MRDGVRECPLCGTRVWEPDGISSSAVEEKNYPDTLPRRYRESRIPAVVAITVLCVLIAGVVLSVCFGLYGSLRWGGYVLCGLALFYVIAVLPCWFMKPKAEIFVPIDHAAIALYALFVCGKTGGRWFLSFAFPVIGICCIMVTALICVLKYVKHSRLFIFGGFLILFGCFTMLIEFFEHISFGTEMFRWSLFAVSGFGAAGLFLIIAGTIRPLRQALEKKLFF